MAEISEYLGSNIRRHRLKRGMTQKDFAEQVEVSQETINAIEKGRKWLTIRTLTKISTALQVSQTKLFEDPEGKSSWKEFAFQLFNILSTVPPDILESLSKTTDFTHVRRALLKSEGSEAQGCKGVF